MTRRLPNPLMLLAFFAALLVFAAGAAANAGVLEGTMSRGNALYESGDYSGAVAEYEKVLRYGMRNGAVHYNLANAWFKLHRPGPAILNYERALRLDPGDVDAARNLAYVRSRIIDRVDEDQENIYLRLLKRFRDALTPDQAAFIFLAAWLVFSGALLVRILGNGAHRGSARGRLVFYTALAALLVMAAAGMQYHPPLAPPHLHRHRHRDGGEGGCHQRSGDRFQTGHPGSRGPGTKDRRGARRLAAGHHPRCGPGRMGARSPGGTDLSNIIFSVVVAVQSPRINSPTISQR